MSSGRSGLVVKDLLGCRSPSFERSLHKIQADANWSGLSASTFPLDAVGAAVQSGPQGWLGFV
jgi:hypothetical protein